jgi:hypothetical protein
MCIDGSGKICCFSHEEDAPLLPSAWQIQQATETNKMVKMYLIDFVAISIQE